MSNKKGFTLIELLIVIVVIGILSVAVAPKLLDYPKKARDAQRKQTVAALESALMAWAGSTSGDATNISVLNGCIDGSTANTLGLVLKDYITIPSDPKAPAVIGGSASACHSWYIIEREATTKILTNYAFAMKMELASDGNVTIDATPTFA